MTNNETKKQLKNELNTYYGKSNISAYPEPSAKHFHKGENFTLEPEIEKIVSDAYKNGCTYADTDSVKYSEKDKEKDINLVQNFLDKVEKRLKQKEY
jgi:flagellar capping protein FliD